MSFEKIAEILGVEEVLINHGPKGVAVHVRIDETWHSAAIPHEILSKSRGHDDKRTPKERRLEVITGTLEFLSDAVIGKIKKNQDRTSAAAREALQYQRDRDRPGTIDQTAWGGVGGFIAQQQLSKAEPQSRAELPAEAPFSEPVSEPMQSRFHAIMAELRCL